MVLVAFWRRSFAVAYAGFQGFGVSPFYATGAFAAYRATLSCRIGGPIQAIEHPFRSFVAGAPLHMGLRAREVAFAADRTGCSRITSVTILRPVAFDFDTIEKITKY